MAYSKQRMELNGNLRINAEQVITCTEGLSRVSWTRPEKELIYKRICSSADVKLHCNNSTEI